MKIKIVRKKQKGIAERKTETAHKHNVPYKAIALGLLLWVFVTWLFFGHGIVRHIDLAEGQTASSTIVAAVDFDCENLRETAFKRTKAAEAIPPVFSINPVPAQRASKVVDTLFDRLSQYSRALTGQQQMIINNMNDLLLGSSVSPQELIDAIPTNSLQETKAVLLKSISEEMDKGVLSEEYRLTWFRDAPERELTITDPKSGVHKTTSYKDVSSPRQALNTICSQAGNPTQSLLLKRFLPTLVVANMTYDEASTELRRKKAANAVAPVIQQYLAGTTLVRAGDSATQQTLLLLKQHEKKRTEEQELLEQMLEIVGNGILLLVGIIATAVILRVVDKKLINRPDQLLLMIILSIFTLGLAWLLTYLSVTYSFISPSITYLIPYALAVLLTGILLGGRAAICIGFWNSFATAVLFDQSFNVFALGMIITVTAASTARNVHRRASLFQAGLWVCAVKVLYVLLMAILNRPVVSVLTGQIFAAILSGMLATVFTLLLIPLFEKIFKITTDITLLELSDMGHPLLQKMAIQAPGTYHHSLMVATLAQNAAEAIGANSLLVRVCAYYHDIGKMAKPDFFTENIQQMANPHDDLSPHMSALIISSHVKEGLTLAKRHKLPKPILDAIEQHHGNGLISYFFHKAKTQLTDDAGAAEKINDADFRYGGAPAVSPEMSILSLADASEAASRSIEKPSPQKISNMINDIFASKIRDGQLDFASLTMAQLNTIKQSFIFSLSNMLHGRIPYPKDHENNAPKSTDKPADSVEPAPKAD